MAVKNLLLSIIMPSHVDRWPLPIVGQIKEQCDRLNATSPPVVEFLCILDNGPLSTGEKMNLLYEMAQGRFVAGIGDDDLVSPDYVQQLVDAIKRDPDVDVVSFDHDYYVNGLFSALTLVSMEFTDTQDGQFHHRMPTPKCAIRAEICKQFTSNHISDKEDQYMCEWLKGRLKTETRIQKPIYIHTWESSNKGWRRKQSEMWNRG